MQAVIISIRPEWCEKILLGEKTVEIRKTKPKLEVPFKCYIYRTKEKGKVIAEFICDKIRKYGSIETDFDWSELMKLSCLTSSQIEEYSKNKDLYGWHISDLKVYKNPKEITEFRKPCINEIWCESCAMHRFQPKEYCGNSALFLKRPPQSWCYVRELEEEQ